MLSDAYRLSCILYLFLVLHRWHLEFVISAVSLWRERVLSTCWVNPKTIFTWSRPFDCILGTTPSIGTLWFLETGTNHFQRGFFLFSIKWFFPARGYNIMRFSLVIFILPSVFRVVVNEDGGVIFSIEYFGTPMQAFAWFIEQDISGGEDDFMCIAI